MRFTIALTRLFELTDYFLGGAITVIEIQLGKMVRSFISTVVNPILTFFNNKGVAIEGK